MSSASARSSLGQVAQPRELLPALPSVSDLTRPLWGRFLPTGSGVGWPWTCWSAPLESDSGRELLFGQVALDVWLCHVSRFRCHGEPELEAL